MLAAPSLVEAYENIPAQILEREIRISSMIKGPDSIPGSYRLFMQRSAGLIGSDLELLPAALGDDSVEFTSKKILQALTSSAGTYESCGCCEQPDPQACS